MLTAKIFTEREHAPIPSPRTVEVSAPVPTRKRSGTAKSRNVRLTEDGQSMSARPVRPLVVQERLSSKPQDIFG